MSTTLWHGQRPIENIAAARHVSDDTPDTSPCRLLTDDLCILTAKRYSTAKIAEVHEYSLRSKISPVEDAGEIFRIVL